MRKQKGNVIRGARDERRNYEPGAVLPYRFSATVTKRGETRRLLSLETETQYLSGGAHRNFDYESLLWDRQLNQSVKPPSLFDDPGALTKQRRTICRAIDDVRFRRTGVRNGSECPKFDELAVVPTDTNKAGHFDAIDFLAAPYVAGSFAEGTYEVLLPVTPKLIAALKPEYRSSFKAQRGASLRAKSFDPYSEHSGMLAQRQ